VLKIGKIKYLIETEPTGSGSCGRERSNVISLLAWECLRVRLLVCASDRCLELLHMVTGTAGVVSCNSQRRSCGLWWLVLTFCVGKVALHSPPIPVGLSCAPVCMLWHKAIGIRYTHQWAAAMQETGLWSITVLAILHWPKHMEMMIKIHFTVWSLMTPIKNPGC